MKRTIILRRKIRKGVARSYWMILCLVIVSGFAVGVFKHEHKAISPSPEVDICEILYQHN
jgi:hypothetical protein